MGAADPRDRLGEPSLLQTFVEAHPSFAHDCREDVLVRPKVSNDGSEEPFLHSNQVLVQVLCFLLLQVRCRCWHARAAE